MLKLTSYLLLSIFVTACSGTNIIENSTYLESDIEPVLKVPDDISFVELSSAYPIPSVKTSVEGKAPEELDKLKTPPDLLNQ